VAGENYFSLIRRDGMRMADRMLFTGKIDEFFNYCFGKLQYRTVKFEQESAGCA
jgi:UDP-galactopyranose mutase